MYTYRKETIPTLYPKTKLLLELNIMCTVSVLKFIFMFYKSASEMLIEMLTRRQHDSPDFQFQKPVEKVNIVTYLQHEISFCSETIKMALMGLAVTGSFDETCRSRFPPRAFVSANKAVTVSCVGH